MAQGEVCKAAKVEETVKGICRGKGLITAAGKPPGKATPESLERAIARDFELLQDAGCLGISARQQAAIRRRLATRLERMEGSGKERARKAG